MKQDIPKNKFKDYNPKDSVWDRIEHSLNADEHEKTNGATKSNKWKSYTPSDKVWGEIELLLAQPSRRRISAKAMLRIAAVFILAICVLSIYRILLSSDTKVENTLRADYALMHVPPQSSYTPKPDDWADALCKRNPTACENADFKDLELQLKNLERARKTVEARISPFGDNSALESKLTKIEIQHAEVMKEMARKIQTL